jgi:hypothetical protein
MAMLLLTTLIAVAPAVRADPIGEVIELTRLF